MGTPAVVGVLQRNDSVKSIYVNYDGYPSNLLPILNALLLEGSMYKVIQEGDASFLATTFATCEFYCRDRHEDFEDVESEVWQDAEAFEAGVDAPHVYLIDVAGIVTHLSGDGDD